MTVGVGLARNGDEISLDTIFTDARYVMDAGLGLLKAGSNLQLDTDFTDLRYWAVGGNMADAAMRLGTMTEFAVELVVNGQVALRVEPTTATPNLISGDASNTVAGGATGAVIAGGGLPGGANTVYDSYCAVSGGQNNSAGTNNATTEDAPWAAVAGGRGNSAAGICCAVGGGDGNLAGNGLSFVGGGANNFATGARATIGGGQLNQATAESSTVAGGNGNHAQNTSAFVGGGTGNSATAINSAIAGGATNTASGSHAAVLGGRNNVASGAVSAVDGGDGALANRYGQVAHASGFFDTAGDAQTSVYVMRGVSTDAALTSLFLDGASQRLLIDANETMAFDALIVGRAQNGQSAVFHVRGAIKNVANNVSLVGTPTITAVGSDVAGANVFIAADLVNRALTIGASGASGTTMRWVATVRSTEVVFP